MAQKGAWWKAVDKIYVALGEIFTYDYPLCAKYLSKYLKGAVKNNKLEQKDYFFANKGAQHDKCPDEAFGTFHKYWLSVAGKEESKSMIALRALGPQKTNGTCSQGPMSTSTPHNQIKPSNSTIVRSIPLTAVSSFSVQLLLSRLPIAKSSRTYRSSKSSSYCPSPYTLLPCYIENKML